MPLYEEKIICPLAVRFTQDHVRPVFQAGMELESTVRQIKAKPGSGGYDVILETPFDAIEIIRWHKRDASGEEPDARHWFTFDNRRLYCLQRAAVALWPKKVGAVVQALYAATDGYQKKDNSTTAGRAVGIGHSPKLLTDLWDWRSKVAMVGRATPAGVGALELVARDDGLSGVPELQDAPAPPSMLELFFQSAACTNDKAQTSSEAVSTTDAHSPRSGSEAIFEEAALDPTLSAGLCGAWKSARKSDLYTVTADAEGLFCVHSDSKGVRRSILLHLDEERDFVWWGSERHLYAQAAEIREQGGELRWYCNDGSWTPKMTWRWIGEAAPQPRESNASKGSAQPPLQQPRSAGRRRRVAARAQA